jgi:hypothetical protein
MSNLASLFAVPFVVLSAPSSVEAIMGGSPVVKSDANALAGVILQCYMPLHISHR